MEQPTLFMIRCSRCKQHLPDEQFMPSVQRKRAGYCRTCQANYMRTYATGSCVICGKPIEKRNMRCRPCATAGRRRPRQASLDVKQPKPELRFDRHGRPAGPLWERIRRIVIDASEVCAICDEPVDKALLWNDPLAATVDHIVPLSLGGHPTDLTNLQLAHRGCNARDGARVGGKRAAERLTFARVATEWALSGVF